MGWWSRKKTVIDAEPKTDTLQPNQPAGEYSMANITVTGDPYSNQTGNVLYGGVTGVTIGNATHTHPISNYPFFVSGGSVGAYTPVGLWTSTGNAGWANSGWANVSPSYILPGQPITGQYVYGYDPAVNAYTTGPSRSEFTEDEIEQAERIMEELSHA